MSDFKFFHPIEVRYGDLDPQGHVNNAKFLTYFEQARGYYLVHLGLFGMDQSFEELGVVVADIHIHYRAPVTVGRADQGRRADGEDRQPLAYPRTMCDEFVHRKIICRWDRHSRGL
jgi:hypothetical protein